MKARDFVKRFNEISPSKEDFIAFGFSESMAAMLLKEWRINSLEHSIKKDIIAPFFENEIVKIFSDYDVDEFKIGLLTFCKHIKSNEDYFYFGNVELDILAISKVTLEIVVLDHDNLDWIVWPCAANDSCFFEAILTFSQFLSHKIQNKETHQNNEVNVKMAYLCAEKAGGQKYLDFYKMILSCDV